MDPFTILAELVNAFKQLGVKFQPANISDKGKAVGIVYTDGQLDDLTALAVAHKDTMLEHKGEYWNIRHQKAGETYIDGQGVRQSRQRDRFTLLTQVTYDDFDSALTS